jgi:hypothetical protein
MSKPWELRDYAEMEARLVTARQMRRDELGHWFADAWRRLMDALGSLSSGGGRSAHHHHSA